MSNRQKMQNNCLVVRECKEVKGSCNFNVYEMYMNNNICEQNNKWSMT